MIHKDQLLKQKGFFLVAAIFLIVVFGVVAVLLSHSIVNELASSARQSDAVDAFNIANSGLQRSAYEVLTAGNNCSALNSLSNISFGNGAYSVTATEYQPSDMTLGNNINSSTTIIPVSSLSGMAPSGLVVIDDEAIQYAGTSSSSGICGTAPCLINAIRGSNGTMAESHTTGATIIEKICHISVQAGVPNLTSPTAIRTLSLNLSIGNYRAWAIGTNDGDEMIAQYIDGTWVRYPPDASIPDEDFLGIYVLDQDDIWISGGHRTFLHWDGTSWTTTAVDTSGPAANKVPNSDYYAIACPNSDDCWAVGDKNASMSTIAHWDGAIWTREDASVANQDLHAITCTSSSDCWAAGDSRTFLHYDGNNWGTGSVDISVYNTTYNSLSCPASNDCWAAGDSGALAHWDGSSWLGVSSSLPSSNLNTITCTSANSCWVVGNDSGGEALFAYYDGTTWQRMTSDQLIGVPDMDFFSIDCVNNNFCIAGGQDGEIAIWNGSEWIGGYGNGLPDVDILAIGIDRAVSGLEAIIQWQQE